MAKTKPRKREQQAVDEFFKTQATELGFTTEELSEVLRQWATSAKDPYQKGLAALYEERYADASRLISESISSVENNLTERYVSLARAEFEQRHYVAAEAALRKALDGHEKDSILLTNLAIVVNAETNRDHSGQANNQGQRGLNSKPERNVFVIKNDTSARITLTINGDPDNLKTIDVGETLTFESPNKNFTFAPIAIDTWACSEGTRFAILGKDNLIIPALTLTSSSPHELTFACR